MSYVVKGFPGVTLVKRAPKYDPKTGIYSFVTEYEGTEAAVRGLEPTLMARKIAYRTDHRGPVWTLFVDDPAEDAGENIDRWEIFTESTEKSLFEHPDAVDEAELYNAGVLVANGVAAYRAVVEDAVNNFNSEIESASWPVARSIIRHLRSGVTGWQLDLVGLRRTRRMEAGQSIAFQVSLDTGLLIYTTLQLLVPEEVAFALPDTPPDISDLFKWGWRKRSQRVEIVESYIEQTVELLFAPWSLLTYEESPTDLAW